MTTDEIREAYLDFFVSKGCVRKSSDVLVPNDKTVLFTPAGMNQFKREFLGLGEPDFTRATTCQKCLRTGDIDNVGKTAFHETFFEMLGNFSFGDYFKKEAIQWAWELLTRVFKIDPNRLSVTVYLDDDEAETIWREQIGLPPSKISRLGEDDNFWPAGAPSQGPNGVCGPCSEIFFHGNGPKEVEIWNLVFTQFNRVGPNELEPLPKKNIDTGMGLERMAACLQNSPNVFGIDIFRPIVSRAADVLGLNYESIQDGPDGIRLRRMADHARALTFTIHENVRPSNEKQGYVIRRLLRRALLDAYRMGRREPFLNEVIPAVADAMKGPYPELVESVPRIQTVVLEEENQFLANLDNGLKLLEETFSAAQSAGRDAIDGATAFRLHDTYGISIEITESLAVERNLRVDREGFEREEAEHKKRSRGRQEAFDVFAVGPLDALKKSYGRGGEFLGYQSTRADAEIIGILERGRLAETASVDENGPPIALVLDRTPFYGEAGGQVGDAGEIRGDGFVFRVEDAKKDHDFTLHLGRVIEGRLNLNAKVVAEVDAERRQAIRRAHTATHVLHHALHLHLGKHAQQAGSKVEPDRLRFDFSNPEAVGRERLREIERTVNDRILRGAPVVWKTMPIDEAKALGAMALFGEKYPEMVRVVEMGDFSRELCGGTHLDQVSQIGVFKIIGEESVSAGTRRLTALTGKLALEHLLKQEEALGEVAATLRVPASQASERAATLFEEIKSLKKEATRRRSESKPSATASLEASLAIDGFRAVVGGRESSPADALRQEVDALRKSAGNRNLAVLLLSATDGRVHLAAGLTPDLVERGLHAGQWLKAVAPVVSGGGGGRADFAQAGGKDPSKIAEAVDAAIAFLKRTAKADADA